MYFQQRSQRRAQRTTLEYLVIAAGTAARHLRDGGVSSARFENHLLETQD